MQKTLEQNTLSPNGYGWFCNLCVFVFLCWSLKCKVENVDVHPNYPQSPNITSGSPTYRASPGNVGDFGGSSRGTDEAQRRIGLCLHNHIFTFDDTGAMRSSCSNVELS